MRQSEADMIKKELDSALSRLRSEIDRVELWAGALSGFAKPIPDYEMPFGHLALPAADFGGDKRSN